MSDPRPHDHLPAHSSVEALLYLHIRPCPICGTGPLDASPPNALGDGATLRFVTACGNCGGTQEWVFDLSNPQATVPARTTANPSKPAGATAQAPPSLQADPLSSGIPINPTSAPSRIIDAVQWVTLHAQMMHAAQATPDRQEARWRMWRAAECLDEALKFYDADGDLPPADSLFDDRSRQLCREHPDRFRRRRLIELRSTLPDVQARRTVEQAVHAKRSWWRWWKRVKNEK